MTTPSAEGAPSASAGEGADIGLIGLAVMGQNLALNILDHGYSLAAYNRSPVRVTELLERSSPQHQVSGHESVASLVASLARPRAIIVMVRAGGAVDAVIDELKPLLESGDIIIDAGNSDYRDTDRRTEELFPLGIRFVGAGVSGGEEGARNGPSIMPGGDHVAWERIGSILTDVAAIAGDPPQPCCDWIGPGGSGHFVKMVHNGIEYGDMQVLAEAYALLSGSGMTAAEQSALFSRWNDGRLESYLVEITAEILATTDDDGTPLIDKILDAAGQKGTGRWTVEAALGLGQPMMLVAEAVGARMVSSMVELRQIGGQRLSADVIADLKVSPEQVEGAIHAAKVISYAQGFMTLSAASDEHDWNLNMASIARLWRGGCIIRSVLLDSIAQAFENEQLENLLFDPTLAQSLDGAIADLRHVVAAATSSGVAVPAMGSALTFYDGLRTARGPASLIQAQRDYFGAHTYERLDRPRGEWFHTDWAQTGGTATSGSYSS
jgi:6-phosphogluconate dehydrogenase